MQRELRKSLPNKIDSLYKVFKFEIIAKIENLTNKRSKVQKYMHSFISVVFLGPGVGLGALPPIFPSWAAALWGAPLVQFTMVSSASTCR